MLLIDNSRYIYGNLVDNQISPGLFQALNAAWSFNRVPYFLHSIRFHCTCAQMYRRSVKKVTILSFGEGAVRERFSVCLSFFLFFFFFFFLGGGGGGGGGNWGEVS